MESPEGNPIPNQFLIRVKSSGSKSQVAFDRIYFQSYDSIIAYRDWEGNVVLDKKYWDYSNTTDKYRGIFLGEDKKTSQENIEKGIYKLEDLNSNA